MNKSWRLDSKAAATAAAFRKATRGRRWRASLAACETVVPIVGLDADDDVKEGLKALREGRTDDSALRARLVVLSARFDDEYLRLDAEGDARKRSEVLRVFAKARGTSAIVFALSGDASQLHEVIYEAMSALVDDPMEVARAVDAALAGSA